MASITLRSCAATLLVLCVLSAARRAAAIATVELDIGEVVGIARESSNEFLGIPFARAGRWEPPRDLRAEPLPQSPFHATQFGPCCVQPYAGLYIPSMSEDCLTLNVFSPKAARPGDDLPVLFWIYGGGGTTGCSAQSLPPLYNGTNLIAGSSEGVVVVTINYRLSIFNRLYLETLTHEHAGYPTAGNYNFLDIQSALRWVQDHISQFGGDPSRVTVFGESAGGNQASELGAARGSNGLFARAISESATAFNFPAWSNVSSALSLGQKYIAAAGCSNEDEQDALKCMRAMPYEELLNRTRPVENANPDSSIVDGWLFPHYPMTAIDKGLFANVGLMIGKNLPDNWPLCHENPDADSRMAMAYTRATLPLWGLPKQYVGDVQDVYRLSECQPKPGPDQCCRVVEELMADYMMNCNAYRALRGLHELGQRQLYWFDIDCDPTCPVRGYEGVCQHTSEIPYVFNTVSSYQSASQPECEWSEGDRKLSSTLVADWVSFAARGEVSSAGWKSFDPDAPARTVLRETDDETRIEVNKNAADRCFIWDAIEREQDAIRFGD